MSKQIDVARVVRTGALIRLHDGNRSILNNTGIIATKAMADKETGRLVEVGGSANAMVAVASDDLYQIALQLENIKQQRAMLIAAALRQPGAEDYLMTLDVYAGKKDDQYIDPQTLKPKGEKAAKREKPSEIEGVEDVTEVLRQANARKTSKRKASTEDDSHADDKPAKGESDQKPVDPLADL